MKCALLLTANLALLLSVPGNLQARPRDGAQVLLRLGDSTAHDRLASPGVLGAAAQDTVYFGGTFWNADSSRWEAIRDSVWTFDTGVGSSFNHNLPDVNPYKDPSLHATMEGWFGIDRTFSDITYFRRLGVSDFPVGSACVGAPAGLGGDYSLWAGVLPQEAEALCYAAGQGYGNGWHVCRQHTFSYGSGPVTLDFDYVAETEEGFDFGRVQVDTSGQGDLVWVLEYTGTMSGHESRTLTPGVELPSSPGDIVIRFCVDSDAVWSDEDGANPTTCGAFAVDNVAVTGGGIDYSTDFESDDGGWTLTPPQPGVGGDWTNLADLANLPAPYVACTCDVSDSVLVMFDNNSGHPFYQNNLAVSPWIDLKRAGLDTAPGKLLAFDIYSELPLLNYILRQDYVRWYPQTCPFTGKSITSDFRTTGMFFFEGGIPACSGPGSRLGSDVIEDFSTVIPPTAEQVQIAFNVLTFCQFFGNCSGQSNTTPWFDNVRLGVYGTPGAPLLAVRASFLPQDAFPEDGSLRPTATGRVDCRLPKGLYDPKALGDTMVVEGAQGGAEVRVQFSVVPGPGTNPTALNTWLGSQAFEIHREGLDWYSARMDTAENASVPQVGYWMTAYHEDDPNFSGKDTDRDPSDLDPNGAATRLRNDIFPDHLFTPGTRLNLFYKARYEGGSSWYTVPDTTGGHYLEMEILPSSMAPDTSFNCVLYVDHDDGSDAQGFIEAGLASVLPGESANFEGTAWDRWDVGATTGDVEPSFGRPLNADYGATVTQALGYQTIIWNSGSHATLALNDSDADVLIPWLSLQDFSGNSFYASGDGFATSPSRSGQTRAATFLEDYLGVLPVCSGYQSPDCPIGKPRDTASCLELDPVVGAVVSTRPLAGTETAEGNGCPENRLFDVLAPNPALSGAVGEEEYVGNSSAQYASISNDVDNGPGNSAYRSVVDGVSLHLRRDAADCQYLPAGPISAIPERLTEVLTWFGSMNPAQACYNRTAGVGTMPGGDEPARTALLHVSPNPLSAGGRGHIRFTLSRQGRAVVTIFDLQGRRVRTVFDGTGAAGENEAVWDGRDASGRAVGSGVYFYRLNAEGKQFSQKLVVLEAGR